MAISDPFATSTIKPFDWAADTSARFADAHIGRDFLNLQSRKMNFLSCDATASYTCRFSNSIVLDCFTARLEQ
jgi:hypothetical protein